MDLKLSSVSCINTSYPVEVDIINSLYDIKIENYRGIWRNNKIKRERSGGNEMSFDAHEEKIRTIFSGDTQFKTPRNQRKYVWEEKQWRELLGDIEYSKKRKEEPGTDISHFLGSFVLQEKGVFYEIIDGQQRITTLFLILSALCIRFNEIKNKEEHGITRQYLSGNINLESQYTRLTNESIVNISFIMSQACMYRENLCKDTLLDRSLMSKESGGNKRVKECFYFYYNYFVEKCENIQELSLIREIILEM